MEELDIRYLLLMARGSYPDHDIMVSPILIKYGAYSGGHNDSWKWSWSIDDASKEELIEIIKICNPWISRK